MSDSVRGEPTDHTVSGEARWLSVHDDLLRGLTHTLSNRIGTIAAAAYMVELQPANLANNAATLRSESERLETLLQLFRLLPRHADAIAEPIIPTDAVANAIALQEHHIELREIPINVSVDGDLQPAYAEPAALALATVVVLGAAHRAVGGRGTIALTVSSTPDVVRIVAQGIPADGQHVIDNEQTRHDATLDGAAVRWLLSAVGGDSEPRHDGAALTVPTLVAARRRSRS